MPPQDLGRKSLLLLGTTWFGGALGMVVSILIARTLGPEAFDPARRLDDGRAGRTHGA